MQAGHPAQGESRRQAVGQRVAGCGVTAYFTPIKSPLSLACWFTICVSVKPTLLRVTQGPEVGEDVGGEQEFKEGYSPKPHLWGWEFSLVFKAPFCEHSPSSKTPSSIEGESGGVGGEQGRRLRLSLGRGPR